MQIVVCIKQILDPEVPPREFRIDPQTNRPVQGGTRLVMDSYAENALEMAIQLRDKHPGSKVTALCLGEKPSEEVLRRALAFTADAAVRIWDPAWADLDGPAIAHVLARAITVLGGADLVLAGRQSGDVEEGVVGPVLAEELGIPCLTLVSRLELSSGAAVATRESDGGHAVVSLPLPAVCTVTSSETNVPRLPKVRDTMMAKGKPIRTIGIGELSPVPGRLAPGVRLLRAYVPNSEVACEILAGKDGPDQASLLAHRLQDLKVL